MSRRRTPHGWVDEGPAHQAIRYWRPMHEEMADDVVYPGFRGSGHDPSEHQLGLGVHPCASWVPAGCGIHHEAPA